jgi:hypothetical protein
LAFPLCGIHQAAPWILGSSPWMTESGAASRPTRQPYKAHRVSDASLGWLSLLPSSGSTPRKARSVPPPSVMLGLEPSIHTTPTSICAMDPRVKPEDDGDWVWPPLILACRNRAPRVSTRPSAPAVGARGAMPHRLPQSRRCECLHRLTPPVMVGLEPSIHAASTKQPWHGSLAQGRG